MKIQLEHTFDFDLNTLSKARAARYDNPEWWPEIDDVLVELDEEKNGVLHIIRRVFLKTNLHKFVDKVISGSTLEVVEESWYHFENKQFDVKTRLINLESIMGFHQTSHYFEISPHKSKRIINIETSVKVPVIGHQIEKIISSEFKKNANRDKQIIEEYVKSREGKL
jgi:hypothetical protein